MVNDFFINGKRAYEKFGLRMSEDFIPALLTPPLPAPLRARWGSSRR